eukprot:520011_1
MFSPQYTFVAIGSKGSSGYKRIGWRVLNHKPKQSLVLYNFFLLFAIASLIDINPDIPFKETSDLFTNFFTLFAILSIVNLNKVKCTCNYSKPIPTSNRQIFHKHTKFKSLHWIFSICLCILLSFSFKPAKALDPFI